MKVQLTTIDLAEPSTALAIDPHCAALRVLVCDRGTPLGEIQFDANEYHNWVSVEQVRTKVESMYGWSQWRHAVEREIDSRIVGRALPDITVAVCTKDRPQALRRCLAAIEAMDYPSFEVIVVDNASSDPTVRAVVSETNARYVSEPRVGLDRARNKAIEAATYDLVAFCDDDVLVSSRWLHGFARAFADPRTGVVTGLVLPAELQTPAQEAFERYGGMMKGFQRFAVDRVLLPDRDLYTSSRWGVGANMAYRRSVAQSVGLFDVGLDVGTPSGGGGDIEMLWRVLDAGHRLRYEPDAWVRHAHRRDRASLVRQIEANGRSYGCFLRTVIEREPAQKKAVRAHARQWIVDWLLGQVAEKLAARDRSGFLLACAELRGALASGSAYRATRKTAPLPRVTTVPPSRLYR